MTSIR
jgi:uncharacterized protein DUF892/uncharacterized protein DUF4142